MNLSNNLFSKIKHIGFVVQDLDSSVEFFSDAFGVGPFKIIESDFFERAEYYEKKYRGEDEDFSFRIALASLGENIEVEFIQPVKGRTVYDEFIKEKGGGLHHIALDVENIDSLLNDLEKFDIKVVQSGKRKGLSWAYVEVDFMNGLILELMDWTI